MEYASPVFHDSLTQYLSDDLESIQESNEDHIPWNYIYWSTKHYKCPETKDEKAGTYQ